MQLVGRAVGAPGRGERGRQRPGRPGAVCTAPNEGAVNVTNSNGFAATDSGTVLPPVTPALTMANVSRA